jgi:hypothetical protein
MRALVFEPGLERLLVDHVLTRGAPGQNNNQRENGRQWRQTHTGVCFPSGEIRLIWALSQSSNRRGKLCA